MRHGHEQRRPSRTAGRPATLDGPSCGRLHVAPPSSLANTPTSVAAYSHWGSDGWIAIERTGTSGSRSIPIPSRPATSRRRSWSATGCPAKSRRTRRRRCSGRPRRPRWTSSSGSAATPSVRCPRRQRRGAVERHVDVAVVVSDPDDVRIALRHRDRADVEIAAVGGLDGGPDGTGRRRVRRPGVVGAPQRPAAGQQAVRLVGIEDERRDEVRGAVAGVRDLDTAPASCSSARRSRRRCTATACRPSGCGGGGSSGSRRTDCSDPSDRRPQTRRPIRTASTTRSIPPSMV